MGHVLRQATSRWTRLLTCSHRYIPAHSVPSQIPANSTTAQFRCSTFNQYRPYSSMNPNDFIATSLIDSVTFVAVCSDTLESLVDYFEQIIDETSTLKNPDVTYGDGVLTVSFGEPHGTYVINRQLPNRQIWLSSPTSGPKRYDFIPDKRTVNEGYWLYRHDGVTLHELLQQEISAIVGRKLEFFDLPHSQRPQDQNGRDG
ncbi:frataxin homolog, mitochondrial [Anopheles stephensi]|uniref:ferroxidase n=1 Tax=Anopheles stephensi TaxID=30069 RepID=A0A182YH56_ANOST|nr:frataxin homolog, mitochondrial [Anopheles stephensi]